MGRVPGSWGHLTMTKILIFRASFRPVDVVCVKPGVATNNTKSMADHLVALISDAQCGRMRLWSNMLFLGL